MNDPSNRANGRLGGREPPPVVVDEEASLLNSDTQQSAGPDVAASLDHDGMAPTNAAPGNPSQSCLRSPDSAELAGSLAELPSHRPDLSSAKEDSPDAAADVEREGDSSVVEAEVVLNASLGEPCSAVAEAPPSVAELAQACITYVERAVGLRLDYAAETLPLLDHYLASQRADIASRPSALALVMRAAGAYFGEVARRRVGAFWDTTAEDPAEWELCAEPVYLSFNPFAVVYDAIHHGDEGGVASHFTVEDEDREAVEARLAELPAVAEEEFYQLSTRLEVLDIIVDAVKTRMIEAGLGNVAFQLEDYR